MSVELLWWLALVALAGAIGCAITTGPTNLTAGVAIAAFLLVVLAVTVDGPPAPDRRRPW